MPLPWKDTKSIENTLSTMHTLRQRKVYEQGEANAKIIIEELEEDIVGYFRPMKEQIQKLMDAGLEQSWERRWTIYGIPIVMANICTKLDMKLPNFKLEGPEIQIREEVLSKIKTREVEEEKRDSEYESARELAVKVSSKFGSVKYLLTQFPELKDIFRYSINKNWKPNPSYKVPPRSSFENCDAFIHFLGGCAMEGIKP